MTRLLARCRGRRWQLRFAGLALLALMLQQFALVAYACPISEASTETPKVVMVECEGMAMPDPEAPVLCDQHCARDHVISSDLKVPQVPPLALPAWRFAKAEAVLPPVRTRHYEDVPACQSDPPPMQRFCSLLI